MNRPADLQNKLIATKANDLALTLYRAPAGRIAHHIPQPSNCGTKVCHGERHGAANGRRHHMDLMSSDDEVPAALRAMGLLGESEPCEILVLPGGVSCDVYAVQTSSRKLCVKRALPKLRVEAEWHAPAERSESEVMWMRLVAGIDFRWVPEILGEDPSRHIFAMAYFPPEEYPLWKTQLSQGRVDTVFAARVGEAIARIHTTTAGRQDIAQIFRQRRAIPRAADRAISALHRRKTSRRRRADQNYRTRCGAGAHRAHARRYEPQEYFVRTADPGVP